MATSSSSPLEAFFKVYPEDSPERFLPEQVLQLVRFHTAAFTADECTRMDSFMFRHTYAALQANDIDWVIAVQALCAVLLFNVRPEATPVAHAADVLARNITGARFELFEQLLEAKRCELQELHRKQAIDTPKHSTRFLAERRAKLLANVSSPV